MSLANYHAFNAEQDALLAARGLLQNDAEFAAAMTRKNEVEQWRKSVDEAHKALEWRECLP
jgi:hypothetical protein